MRRLWIAVPLLVVLCLQPAAGPNGVTKRAEAGIMDPDQRERMIQGIEYLLGEVEFYMEHDLPRSYAGGEPDAPK